MKKKIANAVMVAVIIAVAAAGILGVGHIKGWFDKSDAGTAVLTDFRGIITLQRDGVAYSTTDETVLREGDRITCTPGATVKIALGEDYIVLGQSGDAEIINPASDGFALKVNVGEAFVNVNGSVSLEFDGRKIEINNAVAALSVRKGAQSISVYGGSVGNAKEGQMLEWVGGKEAVRAFSVKSLNDFNISQIRKVNETKTLVFSNDELDKLEEERRNQSRVTEEITTAPDGVTEGATQSTTVPVTEQSVTLQNNEKETSTQAVSRKTESTTKVQTAKPEKTTRPEATKKPVSTTKPAVTQKPVISTKPVTEPKPITTKPVETTGKKLTCTITIRCDTILDNMNNLDPAKAPYVPDNGVILREVTVEFEEGETVFDVLNRVCKQYKIPIEYSWTPMYDSYYIEGINNLYEFDCGSESGWMYKVNGWFPNYGCSSCYLTGGEKIVWCYTCNGLGEDVGAERWE